MRTRCPGTATPRSRRRSGRRPLIDDRPAEEGPASGGGFALLVLGVLGGIAVIETAFWIRSAFAARDRRLTVDTGGGTPIEIVAFVLNVAGRVLGVLAPVAWFAIVAWRVRVPSRRHRAARARRPAARAVADDPGGGMTRRGGGARRASAPRRPGRGSRSRSSWRSAGGSTARSRTSRRGSGFAGVAGSAADARRRGSCCCSASRSRDRAYVAARSCWAASGGSLAFALMLLLALCVSEALSLSQLAFFLSVVGRALAGS